MGWKFDSDRPIYTQLIEQVQIRIIVGEYLPGSKLPSVRDMATQAAVNPNTMQRALSQLENEGLLYSQRTSGRFVTDNTNRIQQTKENIAKELIERFVCNMEQVGYTKQQTIELVRQTLQKEE